MARTPDPVDTVKQMYEGVREENHRQKLLTLSSSSRHIILSYPQDMTDGELLDFGAWLLGGFRAQLPPTLIGPHSRKTT